jgi:aspartyl protease
MSLIQSLAFASLGALTIPALHSEPHCPGNVASLSLRLVQSSLIVASVQINHSGPYDLVVDTGAQITTIEPSLAFDLQLKDQGTAGVGGVAAFSRNAFVYIDSLDAGHSSVSNSLAIIQNIAQLKSADSHIRGILGGNFLGHFDLLIDNRQHILCLDDSNTLAPAVKGKHIALSAPYGSVKDLPFTQPIVVSAHLSAVKMTPVLLRIDSGSNAPVLYAVDPRIREPNTSKASMLKRVVNGVEQAFAVLSAQDLLLGSESIRQVSFVMPMNAVGKGPAPREDGVLPTLLFQRVFISSVHRYAVLEAW